MFNKKFAQLKLYPKNKNLCKGKYYVFKVKKTKKNGSLWESSISFVYLSERLWTDVARVGPFAGVPTHMADQGLFLFEPSSALNAREWSLVAVIVCLMKTHFSGCHEPLWAQRACDGSLG